MVVQSSEIRLCARTDDQNRALQMGALKRAGCKKVFKRSGHKAIPCCLCASMVASG
jgi:hypothetical protein